MPRTERNWRPRRAARMRSLGEAERGRLVYRDPEFLRQFLTERGRIRSRSATGLSRRDQARLARLVKVARELALLPYRSDIAVSDRGRGSR